MDTSPDAETYAGLVRTFPDLARWSLTALLTEYGDLATRRREAIQVDAAALLSEVEADMSRIADELQRRTGEGAAREGVAGAGRCPHELAAADLVEAARAVGYSPVSELVERAGVTVSAVLGMAERGDVGIVAVSAWRVGAELPRSVFLVRDSEVLAAPRWPALSVVPGVGVDL